MTLVQTFMHVFMCMSISDIVYTTTTSFPTDLNFVPFLAISPCACAYASIISERITAFWDYYFWFSIFFCSYQSVKKTNKQVII